MKKLIKILVIALVILSGCKSTKKLTESSVNTSSNTEVNQSADEKGDTNIVNDKTSDQETTTTITEFYPSSQITGINDSTKSTNQAQAGGDKKGAVKSITTTTTKKRDVDKGNTKTSSQKQSNTDTNTNNNAQIENKQLEKSKPATQWKLIAGIVLLIVSGIIYFLIRKKIINVPFFNKSN